MSARPQTRVKRFPARGAYDRATIDAILDEALVCHLGFAGEDGWPYVVPTLCARVGDVVYVHGSAASRMLRALRGRLPACLAVTLLDGLVLARSAFNHSVNYRSAVLFGEAAAVEEPREKERALAAFSEQIVRGRWGEIRPPTAQELKATAILALPIDAASAKVRSGPPGDDEADYDLPVWAGVLPLRLEPGRPEPDPRLPPGTPLPAYLRDWRRRA